MPTMHGGNRSWACPRLTRTANIQDIRKNRYLLTPGRYLNFAAIEENGQAFDETIQVRTSTLSAQMRKSSELDKVIHVNMEKTAFTI